MTEKRWAIAGGAYAALLCACAINPVTGERELALISEGQEVAMGRQAAAQVEAEIGLVEDEDLQRYVAQVGSKLAHDSERPNLPWEFHVVDDPTPNAFALPGGFIFVTRGLMNLLTSEAQLAAVLGHEIGHVTARHSVNQISRAQVAQLGLGIGAAVLPRLENLGGFAQTGLNLLFLKYSRDDERQADQLGFDYMLQDVYDVREMDDVFQALQASSELSGGSPMPSWLASHPSEPDRIEAVRRRVAGHEPLPEDLIVDAAGYLDHVDGLVYGDDPRNGYFANGKFYQPELAIELEVPESWQKRNLPAAVTAVSPEQDAALSLTLAEGNPRDAAARFFAEDGVAELSSERVSLHGFDAIVSHFRAESDGGQVLGNVAHIAGGQGVYRLVAYAPATAFAARRATLEEIVASFAPITDPKVLDAVPRRLDVVRLERRMTLSEFAERYPSVVPVGELAVINHVRGPASELDAGARVKRVVG